MVRVHNRSNILIIFKKFTSDLGFYLNGQMYPNNSIVTITDIGVGDNALFCLSESSSCCRSDGMASGEWFLPGASSPINGSGELFSTANFSRSRRSSAVLLNRRNDTIRPEGLYRCDVIDAGNITQSLYIGIVRSNYYLFVSTGSLIILFQMLISLVFLS